LCSKLCGDLVFVILFPQLTMVVHFPNFINTYGSFMGLVIGFGVRVLGGEPTIHVPAIIHYPWFDHTTGEQMFPFRTVSMIVSWVTILVFSAIAKMVFKRGYLARSWDICECFFSTIPNYEVKERRQKDSITESETASSSKCTIPRNCESSVNLIHNYPAQVKLLTPDSIKIKDDKDFVKVKV